MKSFRVRVLAVFLGTAMLLQVSPARSLADVSDESESEWCVTVPKDETEDAIVISALDDGIVAESERDDADTLGAVELDDLKELDAGGEAVEEQPLARDDETGIELEEYAQSTVTHSDMYRLYNPNSGEHFYTASAAERLALRNRGWKYEGVAWRAPSTSSTPVYRLYSGTDHHYTMSASERDYLKSVGWKYEGVGWYSDDAKGVPLYRLYNPYVNPKASRNNSGSHHYTADASERDSLARIGWRKEGVGWYGVKETDNSGSLYEGVPTGIYQGSYSSDGFQGSGTMIVSLNPDGTFAFESSGGGKTERGSGSFRVVSIKSSELPAYFVGLHSGSDAALILTYSSGSGGRYFSYRVDGSRQGTRGPRLIYSTPGSSGTLYLM